MLCDDVALSSRLTSFRYYQSQMKQQRFLYGWLQTNVKSGEMYVTRWLCSRQMLLKIWFLTSLVHDLFYDWMMKVVLAVQEQGV